MSYNGLEIDMLSLGDADSILVTRWQENRAVRVLIDGGYAKDAPNIRGFLKRRGVTFIDHLVCSHPHDDHGGGLIKLLEDKTLMFGHAWLHLPWNHVDFNVLNNARFELSENRVMKFINESLETQKGLVTALSARRIAIDEPFEDREIGFLQVLSPPQNYYEEVLKDFTDFNKLASFEREINESEIMELADYYLEKRAAKSSGLLDNPVTQPENNSSTILATKIDGLVFLFTGDAGAVPLAYVANTYGDLQNCRWMQIPHHGSRNNITSDLIEYFSPISAYVSACGDRKHPRRAVVNAFKEQGTKVYSTHHPSSTNLWFHHGIVPTRPDYGSAFQLWDQPQ